MSRTSAVSSTNFRSILIFAVFIRKHQTSSHKRARQLMRNTVELPKLPNVASCSTNPIDS